MFQPLTSAPTSHLPALENTPSGQLPTPPVADDGSTLRLGLRQRNSVAEGVLGSEGLVVLAGSTGNAADRPAIRPGLKRIGERLLEQKVARIDGDSFIMESDHLISSPSYAAGALVGGAQNGRTALKNELGKTLREFEEEQFSGSLDTTG